MNKVALILVVGSQILFGSTLDGMTQRLQERVDQRLKKIPGYKTQLLQTLVVTPEMREQTKTEYDLICYYKEPYFDSRLFLGIVYNLEKMDEFAQRNMFYFVYLQKNGKDPANLLSREESEKRFDQMATLFRNGQTIMSARAKEQLCQLHEQ